MLTHEYSKFHAKYLKIEIILSQIVQSLSDTRQSHNFIGNIDENKPYVNHWKHVAKCLICKHQKYCSVHVHDTFVRVVVLI